MDDENVDPGPPGRPEQPPAWSRPPVHRADGAPRFRPAPLPGYPVAPPETWPPVPEPVEVVGRRDRRWTSALAGGVVGGVLVVVVVAAALLTGLIGGSSGSQVPLAAGGMDVRSILEVAQPSVVSISTDQETARGVFGGAGSGVIISDDGLVLTNAHVIAGATVVDVTLSDGRVEQATLVGSLPEDDVALVRIEQPERLVPAELGVSADLVVGDPVVAIGNALDLGGPPSVTTGIVSAKGRTIAATDSLVLDDLIQTDAAINPGNSGGPLVNATGQVVGINTAIIADSENIGFSIAIDSLKPLIDDIREGRGEITPDQAFLGVSMTALDDLSDGVPEEFGVTVDAGVFVSDLVPGSAADQAGVQLGDVILEVDGTSVTEPTEVADIVHDREAGEAITIVLERSGEQVTVEATLSSRADGGG